MKELKSVEPAPAVEGAADVGKCKGYRVVPYGVSLSGTVPCEHREKTGKCPDSEKAVAQAQARTSRVASTRDDRDDGREAAGEPTQDDLLLEQAWNWWAKYRGNGEMHEILADFARERVAAREREIARMQEAVWSWCEMTFDGIADWQTDKERAYRFFEEAGELFQAIGMTRDDALKVVDYVYGRPIGDKTQEIGGVMITLLALASQQNLSVSDALATEYERITRPEVVVKIRNKQRAKNQAFL